MVAQGPADVVVACEAEQADHVLVPDFGNDAYHWDWNACSKDTEAEDGIGLPGHHGCGDERILDSAPYVG